MLDIDDIKMNDFISSLKTSKNIPYVIHNKLFSFYFLVKYLICFPLTYLNTSHSTFSL